MHNVCAARAAGSEFSFAAQARIALDYPGVAQRMPLVRLDRNGLGVSVRDGAGFPPLGLPRQALVLSDDEPLCELRLVARAIARRDERTFELTLQPSRADDHASFWQALRAHQRRHGNALAAAHPGAASCGATPEPLRAWEHCDAAFTLPSHDDALFFADWIEYHFAEISARARMASSDAELRELETRLKDHEVKVRFSYQAHDRTTHACTDETCRWIVTETDRLFGLTAEPWLMDTLPGLGLAMGRLRPGGVGAQGADYSFSSK